MSKLEPTDQAACMGPDYFRTTHWSIVMAAGGAAAAESEAALETLCRMYWYPIYAFVRQLGHPFHEAQDLTQTFFCQFLASECLGSMDRTKGRFRS